MYIIASSNKSLDIEIKTFTDPQDANQHVFDLTEGTHFNVWANDNPEDLYSRFLEWKRENYHSDIQYTLEVVDLPIPKTEEQTINNFLEEWCCEAPENESIAQTELMMDNHRFITYDGKGWYIPKENSLWTDDEREYADWLHDTFA